jgi:hypothetical protein
MRWLGISGSAVGLPQVADVAEAVVTVDVGGCQERAVERGGGASRHAQSVPLARHIPRACHIKDAEDVGGGEVNFDISSYRGDGLHGDLGRAEGQEDGERVVDAGIGVYEDGSGQLTPRSRLRIIRTGGHHIEKRRIG